MGCGAMGAGWLTSTGPPTPPRPCRRSEDVPRGPCLEAELWNLCMSRVQDD